MRSLNPKLRTHQRERLLQLVDRYTEMVSFMARRASMMLLYYVLRLKESRRNVPDFDSVPDAYWKQWLRVGLEEFGSAFPADDVQPTSSTHAKEVSASAARAHEAPTSATREARAKEASASTARVKEVLASAARAHEAPTSATHEARAKEASASTACAKEVSASVARAHEAPTSATHALHARKRHVCVCAFLRAPACVCAGGVCRRVQALHFYCIRACELRIGTDHQCIFSVA
jgi:hypothetical protein